MIVPCPTCAESGELSVGARVVECPTCHGSKRVSSNDVFEWESEQLDDGRRLIAAFEGRAVGWICWIEGEEARAVGGWPLVGVIAEVLGYEVHEDGHPEYVVELSERILTKAAESARPWPAQRRGPTL